MNVTEWIEIYRKLGIWICPHQENPNNFYKDWKNIRTEADYKEKEKGFNWNSAEGICMITGKKGCMVINLKKDNDPIYSKQSLIKVLSLLKLPYDYDWIIESNFNYGIIIDVYNLPTGKIQTIFRDFSLEWENYYCLPPGINNYEKFFKIGIPKHHPKQFAWKDLYQTIIEIAQLNLLINEEEKRRIKKNEIKSKIVVGIILFMVVCLIIGLFTIITNSDLNTWILSSIFTLLFIILIIYMMK